MQFVANGPDIPDVLLQAHEEGRVVFFCGAGISYPAGLPGFRGLVDKVYDSVDTTPASDEQKAYDQNQFDATLDRLERRLPGQRIAVRKAVAEILKPKLHRKGATDTHKAMLQLARNREGALRMVTTNFDRIFEKVAKRTKQKLAAFAAPTLPIPKNSQWDGLVYLHGLLPDNEDDTALHRLVLTSGDFGLAYLTERWAARFVSDLFRNYVVCFVGYSINDPVLQYMMDAMDTDRMLGELTPQAFALGDFELGQEDRKTTEWEDKGVTPILYEVPSEHDHSALHSTLKTWAETYRDGILGKERMVVSHALANPSDSTQQNNFVGRMLWALSDKSGLPAKRFADFSPVPPLAWLDIFFEKRYRQSDLARFGVPQRAEVDENLHFSLLRRPASYTHAPWMSLVSGGESNSQWDGVMVHLARWLMRHLNDPKLIVWLAQQGGRLHDRWSLLIEEKLNDLARLEQAELAEIRANAPNAIPESLMRTLWQLLLAGRVKSPQRDSGLYRWKNRLKRDGLTTTVRLELRELLSPKVLLQMRSRLNDGVENSDTPGEQRQPVKRELVLAADNVHYALDDMDGEHWREALPLLLDDFQQLLRDALDLFCELGEANDRSDRSHWDMPSIISHWQNRRYYDWVALIKLLRDAWWATRESDPGRATRIAQDWFDLPYPTFKRLALFAASQDDCIAPDQWVDWLVNDDAWWLWSVDTQRETMRLLVLQGAKLPPEMRDKLEAAILAGPPTVMYRDDIEQENWQLLVDNSVWLRLAKLEEGGRTLGEAALQRFTNLSAANPDLKLSSHERDEFSHWMSGTGDPGYEEGRHIDIAPRKRRELVKWLKQPPPAPHPLYGHTWSETCRTRFFHSFLALYDLAQEEGQWPARRWEEALQAWSEAGTIGRSWRCAAPLMQTMPDEVLHDIVHSFSRWLEMASKSIDWHETVFLALCRRVLTLTLQDSIGTDDPVPRAINHPVGHVTEVLLNLWFKREPNDNDTLPSDIKLLFTHLCDTGTEIFRHGRVLLASRLIALFRVDRHWTETHLLPLFDWKTCPTEAKAVWEGFLLAPRLYPQLLIAFKPQFLETADHYTDLGEYSRQFAAFLTYVALDGVDGYAPQDFQKAVEALPSERLHEVARTLSQALEGAGEQREDYWRNRTQPFLQRIWPQSLDLASDNIVEAFACMSIAAGDEFPTARSAVEGWLRPLNSLYYVIHLLHKSGLSERFPEDSLLLLDAVIESQPWAPPELDKCLTAIAKANPTLEQDHRYKQLTQYAQQHGS